MCYRECGVWGGVGLGWPRCCIVSCVPINNKRCDVLEVEVERVSMNVDDEVLEMCVEKLVSL